MIRQFSQYVPNTGHDGIYSHGYLSIILSWCASPDIKPHAEPHVYKAHPKTKASRIRSLPPLLKENLFYHVFRSPSKRLKVRLLLTRWFTPVLPCQLHTVVSHDLAKPPTAFNPTAKLVTHIDGYHKHYW